ncbi:MAG: DUF3352 domain-containing protein [Leptolyngbyaceae cyanobacterium]
MTPKPPEKSSKKSPLLLALGLSALVIAAGGAAYWLVSQRGTGSADALMGAEIVPQDALMAFSLSTDSGQWQQLRSFGTTKSQAAFDKILAQLRDRLLTANGFDYARDVKPWVGRDVTIAILPPQAPPSSGGSNPLPSLPQSHATLVVLPIQNPVAAQQVLTRAGGQSNGKSLVERTYKGFQVRETLTGTAQPFSATVLDGKFLVVATDPKATDRVIDTYKGNPSLTATPGLGQAFADIRSDRPFGKLYVNLPAAAVMTAANAGRSLSPQNLAQVQQNQGLAATATLESEGIRFKSVSWLKPDSQKKYTVQNNARIMPQRLPADTLVMASGGNLQQFWTDYSQGARTNPISPINPDALKSGLQSTVGMDLDKDFLPWMKGEFALALIGASEQTSPNLSFSLVFMAQASDRRAAEKTLGQLNQSMAEKYKLKVEESKIGNQTVTNWVLPAGGPNITYGWLANDVVFFSLGAPTVNQFVPQPTASLADNVTFQQAVPREPSPNNGHFFIDVEKVITARSLPLLPLPPANRDLLAALRSLGITAAITGDRSARYDLFTALQKGTKPGPLPAPQQPASTAPNPQLPSVPTAPR